MARARQHAALRHAQRLPTGKCRVEQACAGAIRLIGQDGDGRPAAVQALHRARFHAALGNPPCIGKARGIAADPGDDRNLLTRGCSGKRHIGGTASDARPGLRITETNPCRPVPGNSARQNDGIVQTGITGCREPVHASISAALPVGTIVPM